MRAAHARTHADREVLLDGQGTRVVADDEVLLERSRLPSAALIGTSSTQPSS